MTTTTTNSLESLLQRLGESSNCASSSSLHDDNGWTKIRLALEEDSDMGGLLEALSSSSSSSSTSVLKTIQEVTIDLYDSFRYRPHASAEILQLFSVLPQQLPHLSHLWLDSGRNDEGTSPFFTLPVEALALILQYAPQLTRVALYNVELLAGGTLQLETAMQNHPSLQAFGVVGCRLASTSATAASADDDEDSSEETAILSGLIGRSLASVPTLEWVELTGQELNALGTLLPESLGSLCHSTSLTKLTLDQFELQDPHVIAMALALEHSSTIQELSWTVETMGLPGCSAVGQMLRTNVSLENVTLQWNDNAVGVGEKTTRHETQKDDPALFIAQGLEQNQSIEYFSLCGHAKISRFSQEAFATLLRTNTTLVHCSVDLEHCTALSVDLQLQLELFLTLNECGRKQLLWGDAPPQQWIDTLWKMRHNINGLYYLIGMNPMLCSLAGTVNCNQCEMFDTLIKYGNCEQKIRL